MTPPPFLQLPPQSSTVCAMLEAKFAPGDHVSHVLSSLQSQGWVALGPESRQIPILEVARGIGDPIRSPTGDLVRKLTPKDSIEAIPGSLSDIYGKADFPLHTDTAFWPTPARYLVMRVTGDTRRPTIVTPLPQPFASIIGPEGVSSVWIIRGAKPFYCSMQFRANGGVGIRYDPLTMIPANAAATKARSALPSVLAQLPTFSIDWTMIGTVIIDNWQTLHGRGPEPAREGSRVLERIYVR